VVIDTNDLTDANPAPYDVCIVGSGPAGLTIANELRHSGLRLAVLESGQLQRTAHADQLKKVISQGFEIKHHSRERLLGGASLNWDGLSAPLEPIDFAPRPWLPFSGWPINATELRPYYRQAAERYGFPDLNWFKEATPEPFRREGDYQFRWKRIAERLIVAPTHPQRFGRLMASIFDSSHLDLYTDATVTKLNPPSADGWLSCLVKTRGMKSVTFRATVLVLAAGGIENARLLLASNIGNECDQVGRYFMNHPRDAFGEVKLQTGIRHLPAYFGCLRKGRAIYLALRLTDEAQRDLEVLNSYVRFEPLYRWSDKRGVQLLINYVKSKRWLWEKLEGFKGETASMLDWAETGDDPNIKLIGQEVPTLPGLTAALLRDAPYVAQYGFYRAFDRLRPRVVGIRIRNFMEMAPDPNNRIELGHEKDVYGNPLPIVRYSATDLDKRSIIELHRVLGEELEAQGFGRLFSDFEKSENWPITTDASHHMGATRMGTDPRTSVVDPNCQVHSVPSLYVAGSSVFPTSGYANPTFTLVALAIRLAEQIRTTFPIRAPHPRYP